MLTDSQKQISAKPGSTWSTMINATKWGRRWRSRSYTRPCLSKARLWWTFIFIQFANSRIELFTLTSYHFYVLHIYIFGHKGSGTINAWEEERHQRWGVYYKWRCSLVCRTCHFPGRYSSEVKEFTNLKCWMISESPYDFSHRLRWRVGCWWFLSDLCTLTHLTLQRAVPVYCIQEGPGI